MLLSRYLNLDKLSPRNQEDSLLLTVTETIDSTTDLAGRPVKGAWIRDSKLFRTLLLGWTLYGASCVMADGLLTPAVSVISAVSGTVVHCLLYLIERYRRSSAIPQQLHRPHLNRNSRRACTHPPTLLSLLI
jgi:hypothetical protein